MNVKVGLTNGGAIHTVVCADGASVADVLQAAGLAIALGDQLLHNGKSVRPDYRVEPDALILLGKPIEGAEQ